MPLKLNRTYRLLCDTVNASLAPFTGPTQFQPPAGIDVSASSVEITPPFSLELDVVKTTLAQVNVGNFSIKNLALQTRTLLQKDWPDTVYRPIELWAGYTATQPSITDILQNPDTTASQQLFPRIFRGNVTRCYSYRDGSDFITRFECLDGGYDSANGSFNATYGKSTPYVQIIEDLVNALPFSTLGAIGTFPGTLSRGQSFNGDPLKLLQDLISQFGGIYYIQDEKVYVLAPGDVLATTAPPIINEDIGLLGSPTKALGYVSCEMLFEPGIQAGMTIDLQCVTVPSYNGLYTVYGVHHRGTISPVVCGRLTTSLKLFAQNASYNSVEVA